MARPKSLVPAYSIHGPSGQACCYVERRRIYLGEYGSPQSRERYAAILSKLMTCDSLADIAGRASKPSKPVRRTVNELVLRFATERLPGYARAEQVCQRSATTVLCDLFGDTPTDDFGPVRLRAVRQAMVGKGWSRSFINKQVKRLRHIFRWGVSWEFVSHATAEALGTVASLGAGESSAPDRRPRRAVPDADLIAVRKAFTNDRQRDLFDLLLLTGARSGELLGLTTGAIDRTGDVWRADLAKHKTASRGKSRTLFFNADAQVILQKYLQADPDARLFTVRGDTLSKAFRAACNKADVTEFTPHWLRHTTATRLADAIGMEGAQRLMGHAGKAMTEHYAKAADRVAIAAAKTLRVG